MFRLVLGRSVGIGKVERSAKRFAELRGFIGELYSPELHAKRVDALAGATLGVMAGASLADR